MKLDQVLLNPPHQEECLSQEYPAKNNYNTLTMILVIFNGYQWFNGYLQFLQLVSYGIKETVP